MVLFDNPVADAQSESGTLSHGLGGKKGLEDALEVLPGDTVAVIFDFDLDRLIVGTRPDPDVALVGDGMEGIGKQVHEDLAELPRITLDFGDRAVFPVNLNPILVLVAQQIQRDLDGSVHVDFRHEIAVHP